MFNNKKIIIGVSALVILLGGWFGLEKIQLILKKNTCEKEGGAWNGTSCQKLVTRQEEEKACVDKGNIWNGKSCEKKKVVSIWSESQGEMNWEDAKARCVFRGMKLPKVEELKAGLLHKKWTIKLGCLFILYSKIDWACKA